MNLDLSSLEWPIRLRTAAPMSDEEFMQFSGENSPFRMEREPNGEILIMTATVTDNGFINRRIVQALGVWADEDGRGEVAESSTGFRLPNGPFVRQTRRGSVIGAWKRSRSRSGRAFIPCVLSL